MQQTHLLNLCNVPWFANTLNLIVKNALGQTPMLNEILNKAWKIFGLFSFSCKAKDKLVETQSLMGRPTLKLLQGVQAR